MDSEIENAHNSVSLHGTISPFLYASIVFCAFGLFVAFYMFLIKLGFVDKKRLYTDYHYRVRWIQTLILIFNRLCDVIKAAIAFVTEAWPGRHTLTWWEYDGELKKFIRLGLYLNLISIVTAYIIMLLVYFLTVDRYQRVAMVLPQSKIARFIKATQVLYTICLIYIGTIFIFEYIVLHLGTGLYQKFDTDILRQLVEIRRLVELFYISTGIIFDYAIAIRLIVICTHSKHPASLVINEQEPTEDHRRGVIVRKQRYRRMLAMRMILLLAAMAFIDVSMFTGQIVVHVRLFTLTETEMESLLSIFQSWLSLRILLVYSLLDLFLNGLKQADRFALENGRRVNLLQRLQYFFDSIYDKTLSFTKRSRQTLDGLNGSDCVTVGTTGSLTESSKGSHLYSPTSPVRYRGINHESTSFEESTQNPSYSVFKDNFSDMS